MTQCVIIDGYSLGLRDIEAVTLDPSIRAEMASEVRQRVFAAREFIEAKVSAGERVYGVTMGFGRLADVAIAPEERVALEHNLVRSHASGMGNPFSAEVVRAIIVLRANALASGVSGCRVDVIDALLGLLNAGIHPRVFTDHAAAGRVESGLRRLRFDAG